MGQIHTHYDNLKVTRNAPPEIIRAAYKALSQKYHPDKNIGKSDATRVMTILNGSYEILSDPKKRLEHDQWILKKENELKSNAAAESSTSKVADDNFNERFAEKPFRYYQQPSGSNADKDYSGSEVHGDQSKSSGYEFFYHLGKYRYFYFLMIMVGIILSTYSKDRTNLPETSQYSQQNPVAPANSVVASVPQALKSTYITDAAAPRVVAVTPRVPVPTELTPQLLGKESYIRPNNAPNGAMWPPSSGYLYGYAIGNEGGLSNLTIDNMGNSSDVHLKLYDVSKRGESVREIYLSAFNIFTMLNINAGTYEVRYMDLPTGLLSKSDSFILRELETYSGTQYSNMRITLYKVQGGNMKTHKINKEEF